MTSGPTAPQRSMSYTRRRRPRAQRGGPAAIEVGNGTRRDLRACGDALLVSHRRQCSAMRVVSAQVPLGHRVGSSPPGHPRSAATARAHRGSGGRKSNQEQPASARRVGYAEWRGDHGVGHSAFPSGKSGAGWPDVTDPEKVVPCAKCSHRAQHVDHAGVQPLDAGLRAQRLGRGKHAEQVECSGRDHNAPMGKIAGQDGALPCGRVGARPQGRVGPVQLADLGGRNPCEVVPAGSGEQFVAGAFHAVGEKEACRAFGDHGPMPRALPPVGLAPGGVEREHGAAEVADGPGPLGLDQPQ
jgi:hypothetical protein